MSNEVSTSQDFQTRMFERIRSQIGDLMTEEDLKKIVDAALQKAFFEEKKDTWGSRVSEAPLVSMMRGLMEANVTAAMDKWLKDNPERIEALIQDVIAKGFLGVVENYIRNLTYVPLNMLAEQLRSKGINV